MNTDLAARVSLYRTTSAPLNLIANFFMRGKSVTVVPPVPKLAHDEAHLPLERCVTKSPALPVRIAGSAAPALSPPLSAGASLESRDTC